LGCDVETIRALAMVESGPYGAFLTTGEPVILFEPHWFSRLTGGKYNWYRVPVDHSSDNEHVRNDRISARWRVISRPMWTPGTYGPVSVQHYRLAEAVKYDRDDALKSASWGLFQVLGVNHTYAGHDTLQSFINAAYRSVDDHLAMFVSFIQLYNPRLLPAVQRRDWDTVAMIYNGPGQVNVYAPKLKVAYDVALATPLDFDNPQGDQRA
jgi:hypothetical protein